MIVICVYLKFVRPLSFSLAGLFRSSFQFPAIIRKTDDKGRYYMLQNHFIIFKYSIHNSSGVELIGAKTNKKGLPE